MGMVFNAYKIAEFAHRGQRDKSGKCYFLHPVAVSEMMTGEVERTVALLHDVVEDTTTTLEDLSKVFPTEVVEAVDAISRRKGEETYFEYIERVKANPLATVVKLADLEHNLSPERNVEGIVLGLIKRYQKAWDILADS